MIPDHRDEETVEVVEADPEWGRAFEAARADLLAVLGDTAVSVDHIGSTAVPGLVSKPTIDVLVGVERLDDAVSAADRLATLGYEHRPDAFPPEHEHLFFRRVVDGRRTHHLHVHPVDSPGHRLHLVWRDHLRSHPDIAVRYAELKVDLADRYHDDRDRYVEEKERWVTAEIVRIGPD
jgi:GrpB-like predicted nucleotidyltransferase (UPF0157 family)